VIFKVDVSRILEIKQTGPEAAKAEDIETFYKIIADYINSESLESLKDKNLTISLDIDGQNSSLVISEGNAEFKKDKVLKSDVQFYSDIKTMAGIASGLIDSVKAFLSGDLEIDGDFEKMISFLEILDHAYEKLGIASKEERDILIDPQSMKKLYELYEAGATDVNTDDIPLFFNIFCAFINLNEEAKEVVEFEDLRVQMIIKEAGPYFIYKDEEDGTVKWKAEKVEDSILEFEVSIKTAADVLLGGDAASAYLSGEVTATGNIGQALILQELLELFLEILPFTD